MEESELQSAGLTSTNTFLIVPFFKNIENSTKFSPRKEMKVWIIFNRLNFGESLTFFSVVLVWCAFKETKGVTVPLELGIWLDGRILT